VARSVSLFDDPEFRLAAPGAQHLLEALVRAYPTKARIRALLLTTGIREAEVDFDGSTRTVWINVLQTAAQAGELRELVDAVLRDPSVAGYHPVIRGLLDDARPAPPAPEPAAAAPPAPAASWSVFLCHSSGDKEQVRALYERLTADGVPCWLDQEMLLAGQDWDREIRRAIRASRFVLACVSRESVAKTGYVQAELRRALEVADEQPEGSTFIIPVRLDDCVIPDSLGRWQWVDLFGDSGYGRLLRVLTAR